MEHSLSDNSYNGTRGERAVLNPRLQSFLIAEYNLDEKSEFTDLGGGSNLNLKVSHCNKDYVIRIYRQWSNRCRIEAIHKLQKNLSREIQIPRKLKTKDGEMLCESQGRIIEAEIFLTYSEKMNNWDMLGRGMYTLGRIHSLLQDEQCGLQEEDNKYTNYIGLTDLDYKIKKACERMRSWDNLSDNEREVIDVSEQLCKLVLEHPYELPKQPVHGDYWDNNVLFENGCISFVTDFDFMGIRNRIDDLALTFFFTDAQHMVFDPYCGDRLE